MRDVYGVEQPEQFITFEEQVHLDHTSFIDGAIPSTKVLIEQKGLGKDLNKPIKQSDGTMLTPFQQAKRYITELPLSQHPRWVVTCNFAQFYVYDMERPGGEPEIIALANLEKEYYRLQFLVDTGSQRLKRVMEVSIAAGEIVGLLYDALYKQYANPQAEQSLKSLNKLCVRLVFCLYAEDAGIFGRHGMFHDYLAAFDTRGMRKALVELFLRHPPQGFAAASEADLPVFGTDFDLLTTLEPAILVKIRRLPLFGLWSRLLRFPARFAGTTATEYAPLPKGLEPGALLDGFRERCAVGQSLLIVKDVPEVSPLLGAGDNEAAMRLARIAPDKGFIVVEGQALAYVPIDFSSTDEYLSRLSKSRRKNLRRKLKSRERLDIEAVPLGDARFGSLDVLEELYGLYLGVYAQSEIHFDLLTRDFFAGLLQSREIGGVVFCYRHDGELVGYNICLEHGGMLIDKYIGLRYPQARELDLYFVSWFVNLEHALERGLRFYVAGWTDPEVKAGLGARFTFTRHLVWVRNPILRRILYMFRHWFESDAKAVGAKAADKDTDHA